MIDISFLNENQKEAVLANDQFLPEQVVVKLEF